MSEISKLYENAGVKPINFAKQGAIDFTNTIEIDGKRYPDFTAEKQIELIKLLSYYYNITISKNFENDYTFQCEGDDVRRYVFTSGQDFAEQIASFVNMCYELLPEEERKQIKEILE